MANIKTKDGTNLFYKDWGTGKPVVFVHGWCINCDSWEYIMQRMTAAGYRCIAYDQRGCGRSDHAWEGYGYKNLASDLEDILAALALTGVTLVGHSLGGGVVAQYLADYGDTRIKQAVAIGTTMPWMAKGTDNPEGLDISLYEMALDFIKRDRPAYTESLASDFFDLTNPETQVSCHLTDWTIGITVQASSRAATQMLSTVYNSNQSEELKKINTPFLLLHGDKDASAPILLTAVKAHTLLKNSKLKVYKGKPHGIYINESEMITADILEFIQN